MFYKLKTSLYPIAKKLKNKMLEQWSDIIVKFLFTASVFVLGGLLGELCSKQISSAINTFPFFSPTILSTALSVLNGMGSSLLLTLAQN